MRARYIYAGGYINGLANDRKGHICPKCKKHHSWPLYVFAHWQLSLKHKCDCGMVSNLQNGKIEHT